MNAIKKVLFISYDGMTDPLGQSQVIPYLQGLNKNGYRIFLLSCEKKEAYAHHRSLIAKTLLDAGIEWFPIGYTKKPPVLSTLIDILKLRRKATQVYKKYGIDMVHTRPGIPSLVGAWLKKKYGVKFLNDIREFYADSRVDGGMWNRSNKIYNSIYLFFKRKEAEQVRLSDGIVCLTKAAEKIIRQWPDYRHTIPVEVIPCSADLDLFNPGNVATREVDQWRNTLHIRQQDMVISYLGSIGGWYLTAEMMTFCKRLSDKIPAAKFLFISPHRHADILQAADAVQLSQDKIITVKAARSEVPALLSLSDYTVFFIRPCYSKLSSSPTKHGELMAMGIPVITNSGVGDMKAIVEKYQGGFVIDDFTEATFDTVIAAIGEHKTFDKERIRKGAEETYSLQKAIQAYTRVYKAILG